MILGNEALADVQGFLKARIILTAAELDFFTQLHEKSLTSQELSARLRIEPRATARVLDCLVTFELLEKQNGRYRLTEKGALFSSRHPETVLPMLLHLNSMWDNWAMLSETVKQGKNPRLKPAVEAKDEEVTKAFVGAMHVIGKSLSREIAAT